MDEIQKQILNLIMIRKNNNTWEKLRKDIERYLADYQLSSSIKLLFFVDFWPVILLRLEEFSLTRNNGIYKWFINLITIFLRPFIQGMSGTRILQGAKIDGGLLLHTSVGIVVTAKAVIGRNCTLFSGASVVHKANGLKAGTPVIGNNVKLMNGCKIVGAVTIGDNATIGANAVVLKDVPENSIAVGIPAIIKKKKRS